LILQLLKLTSKCFDGSFGFLEGNLVRVMDALVRYLELAIKKLEERVLLLWGTLLFIFFFLINLTWLDYRNYWLQIREVPQFQAKVSVSMVLREVLEASAVVHLDSCPVCLIDDVFCDIGKVLRLLEDLLKVLVLAVYSID
jgi:hypothetical protein